MGMWNDEGGLLQKKRNSRSGYELLHPVITHTLLAGRTILLVLVWSAGAAAQDRTPFTEPGSKKGIQVQMTSDALALGIRHATLNCVLNT